MSKKPELKIGQIIYVESTGWPNQEVREPQPYEVTKINSKSIYVINKNRMSGKEQRFDKKTWTSSTTFGTDYIWLSPEDYWNSVKRNEDKKALRSRIAGELSKLSLEELQEVAKLMKIKLS